MGSFSGLGIGLSFVFGFILMGLVAELYYLLCWKKRISYNTSSTNPEIEEDSCFASNWKKPNNPPSNTQELTSPQEEQVDLEMGSAEDNLGLKGCYGEEGIEEEIMRMHNLCGPPRFLFTINEDSKEDLESEDGKSGRSSRKGSRTKSLSDFLLSSPTVKKAPTSCLSDSYSSNNHGIDNPFFECVAEAEVSRLRSSPPPKFKFLKDAEDKLITKLLAEEDERKMGLKNGGSVQDSAIKDCQEEKNDVSVVRFSHQAAVQVLPLASSPTFKSSS